MSTAATTPPATTIHTARRVPGGVQRGAVISRAEAVTERQAGRDVVVCGENTFENCKEARAIETAVGKCYHDGPHEEAGLYALPHWQQHNRSHAGHSFYETDKTKALS